MSDSMDKQIVEQVVELARHGHSYTAVELLASQPNPEVAMDIYHEAANRLYWDAKQADASINLARAGIHHGLILAIKARQPARVYELRSKAKALAYNLASYAWPGWDEEGIDLSPADVAAGLEAARLNLSLAQELEKGALPRSRAHWMMGAQLMAFGLLDAAAQQFALAEDHAVQADSEEEALLAAGFGAASRLLADPSDKQAAQRVAEIIQQLAPFEHGAMLSKQIETALRVFGNEESGS